MKFYIQENKAIFKYKNHPNILIIKNALGAATQVLFSEVSLSDIKKELSKLS